MKKKLAKETKPFKALWNKLPEYKKKSNRMEKKPLWLTLNISKHYKKLNSRAI